VHALPKDVLAYQTGTWQAAIRALLASPPYTVPLHALERVVALPSAYLGGGGGGGSGGKGVGEGGTDAKGSAQNGALPIEQTLRALKTTLRALNVSLVGLLVPPARVVVGASGGAETAVPPSGGGWAEHEEAPATAPDGSGGWSDHECVGLGLVRSVDVPNGLILIGLGPMHARAHHGAPFPTGAIGRRAQWPHLPVDARAARAARARACARA
jgi:hypothetical protein